MIIASKYSRVIRTGFAICTAVNSAKHLQTPFTPRAAVQVMVPIDASKFMKLEMRSFAYLPFLLKQVLHRF